METLEGYNFENEETVASIEGIVNKASRYDVIDFIAKVAGLNLLPQNQNKSILLDALLQYIIEKPTDCYRSSEKIPTKEFRKLIKELNNTSLSAAVDPCENVFIQNVFFEQKSFAVFNGIDVTPAYNVQALIRVLFEYENSFSNDYLNKVNVMIGLVLEASDAVAKKLVINLDSINSSVDKDIILPKEKEIDRYASYSCISVSDALKRIDGAFLLDDLCSTFGEDPKGNIFFRPLYTKPFLRNCEEDSLIILNISSIPRFIIYKAIEWADIYGYKNELINRYNEYIWLETQKSYVRMGYEDISEEISNDNHISLEYFKECAYTYLNDQLMIVFYLCDDGVNYLYKYNSVAYPDERHSSMINKRLRFYEKRLRSLKDKYTEPQCVFVSSTIGRAISIQLDHYPFDSGLLFLNPFEIHCISINEKDNKGFLSRYFRAKRRLNQHVPNNTSELEYIALYKNNNNSFHINDEVDPSKTHLVLISDETVRYIIRAISKESRKLVKNGFDDNMVEVVAIDQKRNIYIEDKLFPGRLKACCVVCHEVTIWLLLEASDDVELMQVQYSLLDFISYWLAESARIIDSFKFKFDSITIQINTIGCGSDFFRSKVVDASFGNSITSVVENNHISIGITPESFVKFDYEDNSKEKEFISFLLELLQSISVQKTDFSEELDKVFENPFKKKFASSERWIFSRFRPLKIIENTIIHSEDEEYLYDLASRALLSSGKWKLGVVSSEQRTEVAKDVVDWLYNRLVVLVAELDPDNVLELIYRDLEKTLDSLVQIQDRYALDIACYPEQKEFFIDIFKKLNQTSLALKFLAEYITATPPSGSRKIGGFIYEELLAICSSIIDWAYKSDLFYNNMVTAQVEFLKSNRIGMERDELIDMYQYNGDFMERQLGFNSSYLLRKQYELKLEDYSQELEEAFVDEFGYSYSDFRQIIELMLSFYGDDIVCIRRDDLLNVLKEYSDGLTDELVVKILDSITYRPREDFLKMPQGFSDKDALPWKYNRGYSFIRRPVLERDGCLIWGNRHLYQMGEYLISLIETGKIKANSKKLKKLCGEIVDNLGNAFNDMVFQMIEDMQEFDVYLKVKKINGVRTLEGGFDLGDIDILIVDKKMNKIIVTEVKNFRFSRNPSEIKQEHEKMFEDQPKEPCFATKHERRRRWVENHLDDVKQQYRLDNKEWKVTSLFVTNQPLISQHLYKHKVKCISIAELCPEKIREA